MPKKTFMCGFFFYIICIFQRKSQSVVEANRILAPAPISTLSVLLIIIPPTLEKLRRGGCGYCFRLVHAFAIPFVTGYLRTYLSGVHFQLELFLNDCVPYF